MPLLEIQKFINKYSDRLKAEGFCIKTVIDSKCMAPEINGVIPDIYAEDGEVKRIIVVKDEGYDRGSKELEKLREYARVHQAVSYWEFTISPDGEWRLVDNIM